MQLAFTTGTAPEPLFLGPLLGVLLVILVRLAANPAFVTARWHTFGTAR